MEHLLRELKILESIESTLQYYSYEKEELINVTDRMVYLIHRLKGEYGIPQTEIQKLLDQIKEV